MVLVPEIKLIRTDTTLDLSQKAEKVWLHLVQKSFKERFCKVGFSNLFLEKNFFQKKDKKFYL